MAAGESNAVDPSLTNTISDIEVEFWTNRNIDIAYRHFHYYRNNYGYIVCTTPKVLIAKLWFLNYWFWPMPENNRFHDLMLEKEIMIADRDFENNILRKKLRRKNGQIVTFGSIGVLLGVIAGTILTKKLNFKSN